MDASEDFCVKKGKRVLLEHVDGWRYVIQVSNSDDGDMSLYDFFVENLDENGGWSRGGSPEVIWDASFPALAEAFRFLSSEEK